MAIERVNETIKRKVDDIVDNNQTISKCDELTKQAIRAGLFLCAEYPPRGVNWERLLNDIDEAYKAYSRVAQYRPKNLTTEPAVAAGKIGKFVGTYRLPEPTTGITAEIGKLVEAVNKALDNPMGFVAVTKNTLGLGKLVSEEIMALPDTPAEPASAEAPATETPVGNEPPVEGDASDKSGNTAAAADIPPAASGTEQSAGNTGNQAETKLAANTAPAAPNATNPSPAEPPATEKAEPASPAEELPAGTSDAEPAEETPLMAEDEPVGDTAEEVAGNLSEQARELLSNMAVDEGQVKEALDYIASNDYVGTPYLTSYHPGLTEKAAAQLLDRYTSDATHHPYQLATRTPGERRTVMIPPAFKVDQSPAIWSRSVVNDLGFPFINFTSPSVMELLRGTDKKKVRDAYNRLKKLFRQCGLKKPVATLKEFANANYRNCNLNALVVDPDTVFDARPGTKLTVSIVDPYSKGLKTKGSVTLPVEFLTTFYGVLSPVRAPKQYAELCGMEEETYLRTLGELGKPPMYILNPKRAQFRLGPKAGLIHRLFSPKTAPVLVRARVGGHDGGFIIPEKMVLRLFSE